MRVATSPRTRGPARAVGTITGSAPNTDCAGLLARLVTHAVQVQDRGADQLLRPLGATRIQVGVLQQLDDSGTPMRNLAARLGCHVSNLTGVVDRLRGQGWVRRQRAQKDRRSVLVRLTEEGRAARDSIGAPLSDLQSQLAGALSAREQEQLCKLLQKYIAGAEQVIAKDRA